jgi:hypothetical protein
MGPRHEHHSFPDTSGADVTPAATADPEGRGGRIAMVDAARREVSILVQRVPCGALSEFRIEEGLAVHGAQVDPDQLPLAHVAADRVAARSVASINTRRRSLGLATRRT